MSPISAARDSSTLWPALARQIRESSRPAQSTWPRILGWSAGLAASLLIAAGAVYLASPRVKNSSAEITSTQKNPPPVTASNNNTSDPSQASSDGNEAGIVATRAESTGRNTNSAPSDTNETQNTR
jgi:hypothetical protein